MWKKIKVPAFTAHLILTPAAKIYVTKPFLHSQQLIDAAGDKRFKKK